MRARVGWLVLTLGCGSELTPQGEAIVIVDTDAPVPKLVNTLRVDFYRDDGSWFDSLEARGLEREAWPVSFSVFHESETGTRAVLLRLRAFSNGKVRDYRGERFADRPRGAPGDPVLDPEPPPNEEPRLVRAGLDVTPTTEPLPNLTIDRLVRIELAPGLVGAAPVVLRTACAGTMANLATGESCSESEGERQPLPTLPLEPGTDPRGRASLVGTYPVAQPCPTSHGDAVCVPGGILFLGDLGLAVLHPDYRPSPERIAVIPTLLVDRDEVTVARWRAALARGFGPPAGGPFRNDGDAPLATSSQEPPLSSCTWSASPLVAFPREDYPLNCVTKADARAFCQYHGGDLLTEAQWEYVAASAGRDGESVFAWGNEAPSCETVVYARHDDELVGGVACAAHGFGPRPVADGVGDLTPVYGIHGLGGNVMEWVLDDFRSYRTVCWAAQPLRDPRCLDDGAAHGAMRGGSWFTTASPSHARASAPENGLTIVAGFRCAWQLAP